MSEDYTVFLLLLLDAVIIIQSAGMRWDYTFISFVLCPVFKKVAFYYSNSTAEIISGRYYAHS